MSGFFFDFPFNRLIFKPIDDSHNEFDICVGRVECSVIRHFSEMSCPLSLHSSGPTLLVPKLCLGTLNTEAPASGNEAELQKKQFPSRSLGTRQKNESGLKLVEQC
ncbi:MAG: hypothetical protein D3910_17945 [Candidatus Electrothrix sp. ATG2]|nr:hypothetical protein [Candidatus Electrothrix sp. ATG2]